MADTTPAKDAKPEKATAAKAAAPKASVEKKAPAKAAAPKVTAEKKAPAKAAAPKVTAEKKAPAKAAAEKKAPATAPAAKAAAPKSDDSASAATIASTKAPKSAPAKKAAKPVVEARPQVLKMHHLRPAAGSKTARTRVGRGEGSKGKTAGRGTKGTKARYQVRLGLEGGNLSSIMRTPKLRGFTNPFRVEYQVVNLEKLAELYPKGGDVTVSDLVAKGAVRKNEKVKVLGDGDIAVKLNVAVDKVSGSAEQKIVAAGGSIH
jgi:large subunit ribosomal protein L15